MRNASDSNRSGRHLGGPELLGGPVPRRAGQLRRGVAAFDEQRRQVRRAREQQLERCATKRGSPRNDTDSWMPRTAWWRPSWSGVGSKRCRPSARGRRKLRTVRGPRPEPLTAELRHQGRRPSDLAAMWDEGIEQRSEEGVAPNLDRQSGVAAACWGSVRSPHRLERRGLDHRRAPSP